MKNQLTDLTCTKVSDQLYRIFDENSLAELPGELNAHIEECANCKRQLHELVQLRENLTQLPTVEREPEYWVNFLPNLRQHLETVAIPARRKDLSWIPAFGLGLVFVLFLIQSPVIISPPSWFTAQTTLSLGNETFSYTESSLSAQDYEQLNQVWENEEVLDSYINKVELIIIEGIADAEVYQTEDTIDNLAQMDEETLDYLFKQLKSRTIIQS